MASFSSLTRAALLALVPFCIGPGFCASPRALRASIAGAGTHQTREHYLHTSSCHLRAQRAVRSAQGRRARGRQARSSGAHPRRTCERTCWSNLAVNLGGIGKRSGLVWVRSARVRSAKIAGDWLCCQPGTADTAGKLVRCGTHIICLHNMIIESLGIEAMERAAPTPPAPDHRC